MMKKLEGDMVTYFFNLSNFQIVEVHCLPGWRAISGKKAG